jgi:hypothetical protein
LNDRYFKSDERNVELDSCLSLHTIIDDHAGDTECFLGFCKSGGDGGGVGEVAGDVQLVGCASGFSRGDCYTVTFCCKGASYALADVGACTEDEDDGRCARHWGVVGLCLIGMEWIRLDLLVLCHIRGKVKMFFVLALVVYCTGPELTAEYLYSPSMVAPPSHYMHRS